MPTLRKCSQCGEPNMAPFARKMEPYNSVYHYKCSNCQHEVELVPPASSGMQLSIGLMVAAAVWFIFFGDNMPKLSSLAIYLVVMGIVPGMALYNLWKQYSYGIVDNNMSPAEMEVDDTKKIPKSPIVWVEKRGLLGGFLVPVVLVIVVLGAAAILGYINYTYFDDKLFS